MKSVKPSPSLPSSPKARGPSEEDSVVIATMHDATMEPVTFKNHRFEQAPAGDPAGDGSQVDWEDADAVAAKGHEAAAELRKAAGVSSGWPRS